MAELDAQIGLTADASGVEAGVGRAKKSLASLGASATKMGQDVAGAGDKAGKALGGLGDGGEKSAKKIERDTKSMQSSIQRYIATLEAGSKDSRKYWEQMADFKGVDKNALRPLLDQLDRVTANTKVAESATSDWRSELTRLGPLMASVFSGAAMLGFGTKLVAVQREFDVLNSSLKTVTGSSAAAEREMAWLKDFAKETPFGLAQATQGFVKMKALGLDPTRASLTSFGNTASAMGKDLNQMIEAVADASTGEFERLKEFGIKAKKEGDNVSLTFQGVTTTIKNSAAEITSYLEQIGNNQFGGAMEERARTLDGAIAGLGDTWDELFRTVNDRNAGTLIHDSVKLATGAIEDATTILRAMTGAANDNAAATGAMSTIQNGIATVFETVAVLGANLSYVLQGVGREIGGLAAQVAQAAQFNFAGVSAIREQMVADAQAARREIDATTARILNARKEQEEYARWATRNASAATDPRRVDLGGGTREAPTSTSKPRKAAIDAEARAYENLIKTINAKIAAEELELAGGEKLTESQRLRVQFAQELQTSLKGLSAAKVAEYTASLDALDALEKEGAARKEFLQIAEQERQQRLKIAQAAEQSVDSLATGNQQLRDEIQLIGLSATEQMEVLRLREESVLLVKEQHLAEMKLAEDMTGTMTRELIALEQEIDARRELLGLIGSKEAREANKRAAEEAAKDWERTAQTIGDTLADYIMSGGKDAAQYLKRLFATLVLQPTVQVLVGSVLGTGPAAAASGSSNILGTASNLGSLGAFGGTVSAGLSYGSTSLFANGLGTTLAAGGQMIGAGSIVSGISTIAGALGPIALGVAALTSLIGSLDDSGTPHMGGAGSYSAAGGQATGLAVLDQGLTFGVGERYYNSEAEKAAVGISQGIVQMLDSTAQSFGQQAGYFAATAFADDSSKDGAWGSLRIMRGDEKVLDWADTQTSKWAPKEFSDGEAGQKEYAAAIAASARDALKTALGDADWAKDMLDTLGDSVTLEGLDTVVAQINQAKAAFTSFGQYMPTFAGLAESTVSALVDAAGGVGPLSQGMATFVENFYTDAEKLAINTENVRKAMQELGFEMPETRDEFKALVQAQLALGDAGAKTAAGLLGLSGAVAAVLPAAEAAQAGIASVSEQLQDDFGMTADAISGILNDAVTNAQTASEAQRMAAQAFEEQFYGGAMSSLTDSLGAMIQSSVIAPMMESLIAGSAASASLLASGGAVAAGAMASGGAAGGAASAAGGSYAADAMASGGASAANAMVSGGSAAGAIVASAVEQARAQVNAYTQILSDPDVQAGIKDISKLMGEVAGMTFTASSSWGGGGGYSVGGGGGGGGAGSEADKLAESLKKLGETVEDEIKRLAGLMNDADPQKERAALLAEFAVQTAKAKTGDQAALGELTSLSKAIEQATKLTAASAFDLAETRGWLASSLEDTLKALNLELPKFDVGTNYVPRTMAAIVHEGEAIVPKAYNPWAGGAGGGQDQTALASEIRALREENRQQAGEIARLNLRMTRVLERWDGGGMPPERLETA